MNLEDRVDKIEGDIIEMEKEALERLITLEVEMKNLTTAITKLVTIEAFWPVRLIAYGLATSVFSTVVALVLANAVGAIK